MTNKAMMRYRTSVSLLAFTAVMAGQGLAYGQEATDDDSDRVVVTGSRIVRDGFEAPTPTTIVDEEAIERTGLTKISDVVNQLPQVMNSRTATVGNQQISDGIGGLNLFNLRNLGTQRVLVLMDGRRIVPISGQGYVDNNNIPNQLIQRVDVVTGGASAAYGSDAVAGVVNYILNKEYVGVKGSITGGVSDRSDGEEFVINLSMGSAFAEGRGHILLSGEYSKNGGVRGLGFDGNQHLASSARDPKRAWWNSTRLLNNPDYVDQATTPNIPALITRSNVYHSQAAWGGLIHGNTGAAAQFNGIQFGPGGEPMPFVQGELVPGNPSYMIGGQPEDTIQDIDLQIPVETYNLFGRVSYDFTDNLSGYLQGMMGYSDATGYGGQIIGGNFFTFLPLPISVDNPYLDSDLADEMRAAGVTTFNMGLNSQDAGLNSQRNLRENYMITAGLEGSLNSNWNWDAYVQYGKTDWKAQLRNNIKIPELLFAINAVDDGGVIRCANPFGPGNAPVPGCSPWNIFGTGVASQQALDYVFGVSQQNTEIEQTVAEASISGDLFSTWAGPVAVVGGVGYRKEEIATPYIDARALADGWGTANYKPTDGSYDAQEVFAETVIPLAADMPFAQMLDLNAAVRLTDYSTSGTVTTWKAGLNYRPIDDLLFRGVVSRDIRAGSLSDLFAGGGTQTNPVLDPRYGGQQVTNPLPLNRDQGNPFLNPEEADTWSIGAVYQPSWLDGFSFSYDYYEIELNDGIAALGTQQLVDDCEDGTRPDYCVFITRGPGTVGTTMVPDTINEIILAPQNLATFKSRGADIAAAYRFNTASIVPGWNADVSIRTALTNILESSQDNGAGSVHDGAGEPTTPDWTANTEFVYAQGPWTGSLTWRRISESVQSTSFFDTPSGPLTVDNNNIPSVEYFDLGVSYQTEVGATEAELFLRVNNLFDQDPPFVMSLNNPTNSYNQQTDPAVYDVIGRYYRAGIRFEF